MSTQKELIEYRMDKLENAVETISEAVKQIAEYMGQIVALEREHAETRRGLERAFAEIQSLQASGRTMEARIVTVEKELPSLVEVRTNINRGLWILAGTVILAIFGVIGLK